jgi:hypothetical protein
MNIYYLLDLDEITEKNLCDSIPESYLDYFRIDTPLTKADLVALVKDFYIVQKLHSDGGTIERVSFEEALLMFLSFDLKCLLTYKRIPRYEY